MTRISREERADIRSDTGFFGRLTAGWVVIALVLVLALSAAVWGITVAVSGPKGQGDAVRQKNSAENWVKQQAEFNRRYQGILAADKNITVAAGALQRDPSNVKRQIDYDGLVRNCNDAVASYDSLAREYLAEQFRDADLPAQIDQTDPATDCQETKEK